MAATFKQDNKVIQFKCSGNSFVVAYFLLRKNLRIFFIISVDFNRANLKTGLPKFYHLHLPDDFIQSDLQCIQAIHFFQYVCSLGIEPTNICATNAMLYH